MLILSWSIAYNPNDKMNNVVIMCLRTPDHTKMQPLIRQNLLKIKGFKFKVFFVKINVWRFSFIVVLEFFSKRYIINCCWIPAQVVKMELTEETNREIGGYPLAVHHVRGVNCMSKCLNKSNCNEVYGTKHRAARNCNLKVLSESERNHTY